MIHELKSWPKFFTEVLAGCKTFEIRINDRNFAVGDELRLREWEPTMEYYTGRELTVRVPYILGAADHCAVSPVAINPGYVVMSIGHPYFVVNQYVPIKETK